MAEINRAKSLLRKVFRDRAKQMPEGYGSACEPERFPEVWKARFRHARRIAAYRPLPDELSLDTVLLCSEWKEGKFCFPRVEGEDIRFYEADSEERFRSGAFSIEEPDMSCEKVDPDDIDIILVPAVAYGMDGTRIGRGKGFYDRFISQSFESCGKIEGKYRIGVVPACRVLGQVPSDSWDMKVDAILTEGSLIDLAEGESLYGAAADASERGKGEKERR